MRPPICLARLYVMTRCISIWGLFVLVLLGACGTDNAVETTRLRQAPSLLTPTSTFMLRLMAADLEVGLTALYGGGWCMHHPRRSTECLYYWRNKCMW